jgi:hypothetical protein
MIRWMTWVVVALVGMVVGFFVGRWWALLAPFGFGAWVWTATGVDEVPPWLLGALYAVAGCVGVTVGVLLRRRSVRSA